MEHKMFCYQCQETAGCSGCTQMGVCGKKPEVAAMQDLLVYVSKGLSAVTTQLRKEGTKVSEETNHLITWNLFTTITNANFDNEAIIARIHNTLSVRRTLILQVKDTSGLPEAAFWDIKTKDGSDASDDVLFAKAKEAGVLSTKDEDIRSLRELITYGLKGLSAYSKHANVLLSDDPEIDAFLQRALAATLDDSLTADDLVALTLETGNYGVRGMAMLDTANTGAYGNPEITRVNIGVGKNPGILVSGHDLKDLEMLLEQTQGTGVDVYTHSEMLPAHYYPAFKKYPNFVGNYGNAWWKQKEEFERFHGPILMTTNCIVPPKDSYKDRLYTTGAAGYPGCTHIDGEIGAQKDFSALIEQAKHCSAPEELEHYVRCFVEDCGYTGVWDEFSKELKSSVVLPAVPLLYTASWLCDLKYRWNFREASSLAQVAKCRLPMLFIHGDADDYVPTWMVRPLFEAKPGAKELWLVPGAGHAASYRDNREEYTRRVGEFVGRYIGGRPECIEPPSMWKRVICSRRRPSAGFWRRPSGNFRPKCAGGFTARPPRTA